MSTAGSASGLVKGFTPLRHRDFAIYWVAQLTSNVGTQMEATATTWLLYRLTDSAIYLGFAGLARALPVILLTLFAGTLSDRFGARTILLITQTAYVALSAGTGFLVITGTIQPWHLLVNSAFNSVVLAFDAPARQALYPNLIPPGELRRAVPLNSAIRYLGLVTGPAIGGVLIAASGAAADYFVNALTYLALVLVLPFLRIRATQRLDRGSFVEQTREGLRHVIRTPLLASVIGLLMLVSTFSHSASLVTIYASDVLHTGADGLGLLLSAVGLGAVAGSALLLTVFNGVRKVGAVFVGAGLIYATALAVFGISHEFAVSLAALAVMGICSAAWGATGNTIVQVSAPLPLRGRVLAVHVLVTRGFDGLSGFQIGVAIGLLGATPAVLLASAAIATAVLATAVGVRSFRRFRLEPDSRD